MIPTPVLLFPRRLVLWCGLLALGLVLARPCRGQLVASVGTAASDYANTSHHVGATARFSPYGDGLLAVAISIYPTETLLRSELSFWLPIAHGLRIRPAAAVQWSGGALLPSGALTLGYEHRRLGLYVGGKYGPELRPAQLDYEVIYNGPERIPYGLWAGAAVRPGAHFALLLSYAYDRMQSDGTDTKTDGTSGG